MACGWLLGFLAMLSTKAQSSPGHEYREMGNHKEKHKRQEHGNMVSVMFLLLSLHSDTLGRCWLPGDNP